MDVGGCEGMVYDLGWELWYNVDLCIVSGSRIGW